MGHVLRSGRNFLYYFGLSPISLIAAHLGRFSVEQCYRARRFAQNGYPMELKLGVWM